MIPVHPEPSAAESKGQQPRGHARGSTSPVGHAHRKRILTFLIGTLLACGIRGSPRPPAQPVTPPGPTMPTQPAPTSPTGRGPFAPSVVPDAGMAVAPTDAGTR